MLCWNCNKYKLETCATEILKSCLEKLVKSQCALIFFPRRFHSSLTQNRMQRLIRMIGSLLLPLFFLAFQLFFPGQKVTRKQQKYDFFVWSWTKNSESFILLMFGMEFILWEFMNSSFSSVI
jgi:hypothetical protein